MRSRLFIAGLLASLGATVPLMRSTNSTREVLSPGTKPPTNGKREVARRLRQMQRNQK